MTKVEEHNEEAQPGGSKLLADFQAELDVFCGPLDLLLYLIKQQEVDVLDVPIARITDQYLRVLRTLQFFNVNLAAEFTVVAATLMEIKSRSLLPDPVTEEEQEEDPARELVERLLQYKSFKEAACRLEEMADFEACKFPSGFSPRQEQDEAETRGELALESVDLWELVSAYARVIEQTRVPRPLQIVYDDVPLSQYMEEVRHRLGTAGGRMAFLDFFRRDQHRARVVGIFLALLELVRQQRVRVHGTEAPEMEVSLCAPSQAGAE